MTAVRTGVPVHQASSTAEEITFAEGVDPEDYRGTTVRFATWKDPANGEGGAVVEAFQKKYGINVKIDLIPQNQYSLTIARQYCGRKFSRYLLRQRNFSVFAVGFTAN